ncbi:MAG: ABC transporter ATP-binding protein/permease [Propionibacteriaceae bacterium]|jgi:ATP-binding cassette subfamily B protein|nr:ABC transporter ATP-binding protein/permease [Propionibacteriaceae bacterium]
MAEAAKRTPKAPKRDPNIPQHRGGPGGGGPGMRPTEKAINFWPSLKRLLKHLTKEVPLIALVLVFVLLATIANSVNPAVLGHATDLIFNAVQAGQAIDFGQLGTVLFWALALALGNSLFQMISGLIVNGVVQRTVYRMRKQVSQKLDHLPLSYFDAQPRGELLSRVTNDVDNIAQSLQQTLSQVLSNLFTLIGVLAMMFYVSWVLALVTLVSIPIAIVITTRVGKRSQKLFAAMWKRTGELNAQVEESYSGHSLVKVFGRQHEVAEQFKAKNEEMYQASFGAQFISSIIMPLMFFVGNLTYVVIAVVGGFMVTTKNLGLGSVQAFIQYSRMFTQPITQLASMANLLQSGVASAERVFEVLDTEEEVDAEEPAAPNPALGRQGKVVFDHVYFSYNPEKPLIQDLSLVAEPGATVAIVGPTGAGKTTLVNLIMRFYELDGGKITLDGVDITTVPRRELRSHIGMVLQDTWLFAGSIRDNIAYGKEDATEEEIMTAAKATYVDRFVRALPEGYDTRIDEDASNVSAGEKQLITIARAFISQPSLLILDEATSSVDTRTELLLQRAMNKLRAERTSFVIAHRLSTIRDADLILVMEDGAIVEQGTHTSLLAAQGAYYRLYQAQFAGLQDD